MSTFFAGELKRRQWDILFFPIAWLVVAGAIVCLASLLKTPGVLDPTKIWPDWVAREQYRSGVRDYRSGVRDYLWGGPAIVVSLLTIPLVNNSNESRPSVEARLRDALLGRILFAILFVLGIGSLLLTPVGGSFAAEMLVAHLLLCLFFSGLLSLVAIGDDERSLTILRAEKSKKTCKRVVDKLLESKPRRWQIERMAVWRPWSLPEFALALAVLGVLSGVIFWRAGLLTREVHPHTYWLVGGAVGFGLLIVVSSMFQTVVLREMRWEKDFRKKFISITALVAYGVYALALLGQSILLASLIFGSLSLQVVY